MTLIFVTLGVGIIGIVYGRIKGKEPLLLHRWIMTGTVMLALMPIFFVMFPSLYNFYTNPAMNDFSTFSIVQLIHSIIGFPAITISVIFAFNDLPKKTKKWMRYDAILWLTTIALGAIVYFTMPN